MGLLIQLVFAFIFFLIAVAVGVGSYIATRPKHPLGGGGQALPWNGTIALWTAMTQRLRYVTRLFNPGPAGSPTGFPARAHMTRELGGRMLHWVTESQAVGQSLQTSMRWELALAAPARIPLHIASAQAGVPMRYPVAVPVDNPSLSTRVVASTVPGFESYARAILADPALASLLVHLPFVDLFVEQGRILCLDPQQRVVASLVGGPLTTTHMLGPEGIERIVWLHETVASILCLLADRTA